MKKITKIGIFLIFSITIILINYSPVEAVEYTAGEFYCTQTCQIKEPITNDTDYWRQAAQEKCIRKNSSGDSVIGCEDEEDYKNQCCESITISQYKATYGNYTMKDILTEAITISEKLLGIVGSIALLFFIIAGIKMIFAGGVEEKISSARTMMVQTIIGLVIFLSAYLIISFIQETLIGEQESAYKLETSEQKFE